MISRRCVLAGVVALPFGSAIAAPQKYVINLSEEAPPHFSYPLTAYLLGLHAVMPDDERPSVLPFAAYLPGSTGSPAVEQQRLEYIGAETVRRVLSLALTVAGLHAEARRCATVVTLDEAVCAVLAAKEASVQAANAAWRRDQRIHRVMRAVTFMADHAVTAISIPAPVWCAMPAERADEVMGRMGRESGVIWQITRGIAAGAFALGAVSLISHEVSFPEPGRRRRWQDWD
jgi:hypothetical protein